MEQLDKSLTLEALYNIVSQYDDMQEQVIKLCIQVSRIEKEEDLYISLDMDDVMAPIYESLDFEKYLLEKDINNFESVLEMTDINEVLLLINTYEQMT